jgi:membrane protein YqaA with SNARE-associated domain
MSRIDRSRIDGWFRKAVDAPGAPWYLGGAAFIEASVFPIPPDFLLVPLGIAHPGAIVRLVGICIAGSTGGAMLGYFLGNVLYAPIVAPVVAFMGLQPAVDAVLARYGENPWLALVLAGFTNIPFSVFTVTAGFRGAVQWLPFFAAVLIGRLVRFSLVGALLHFFGPAVRRILDRVVGPAALVTGLLLIVAIVAFLIVHR